MRLYHGVSAIPATAADFRSNAAKGRKVRPPITPEKVDLSRGVSTYDTLAAMQQNLVDWPANGPHIAVLDIPDDGSIRREKTLGSHHWTVWGDPAQLLAFVTDYIQA